MHEEIYTTTCGVCHNACPINAVVRDGVVVHIEPSKFGNGYLCAKGHAARAYVYREDRLKTPLKRIGKRGGSEFEPITWDEAYREIAQKVLALKEAHGADSIAFYTGYSKWYRPLLHRLTHSFGTLNYGTESSSCFQASVLANLLSAGVYLRPDLDDAELLLSWGENPFHSTNFSGRKMEELREKGLIVISIDPRLTPYAQQYADIHLRPRPGTDGALAHFFAKSLIDAEAVDSDFIVNHVHGYGQYAEYVKEFDSKRAADITGIPETELIKAAAVLIAHHSRFAIGTSQAALTHHVNGVQNYRAVTALAAITGNIDREGGLIPIEYSGKLERLNEPRLQIDEFIEETRPKAANPKIGSGRFPLWSKFIDEFQAMDLSRNILEGTPYPIRAIIGFGVNARMFPGNKKFFEALEALDFFLDVDIFMTDAARYADIILPACAPCERTELVGTMGGPIRYSQPAIAPLYESRSDADIICELAEVLDVNDSVLRGGYDVCILRILRKIGLTLADMKSDPSPRRTPGKEPYIVGSTLGSGFGTPTGKFELYSESVVPFIESHGLNPLPVYKEPPESPDSDYPLVLAVGGRLPFAFHSRFHNVAWARSMRPEAAADIHPSDAQARGIKTGDSITLKAPGGEIDLHANVTQLVPPGSVFLYQGYSEADGNSVLNIDGLDPYSGFPAYRSAKCEVRKQEKEKEL